MPVRIVVIVLWISVVILSIAGFLLLFRFSGDQVSTGTSILWGLEALVVAMIYAAVARGLSRGANSARVVVAVVAGIHVAFSIWQLLVGENEPGAIAGIAFQVVIIYLLYGPASSKQHFAPYAG
ncbi:MAG: hypothetical protein ABWX62_07640 [Microterricola sp.]